jgi:hypothetical protein
VHGGKTKQDKSSTAMITRKRIRIIARKMMRLIEVHIFFAISIFAGNAVVKHSKMMRLIEVHIFFAMSIFAGNAVVKHSTVVHKSHDKRQKVAVERSVPLAQSRKASITEVGTIEKGEYTVHSARRARQPLHSLWSLIFLYDQNAIWRVQHSAPSSFGIPPCLTFNMLQQLIPLRI